MKRTARYLTKAEIEKIRALSKDHYIKDIAREIGVSKMTVRKVQDDPRNNIVNPKRKYHITGKFKGHRNKVGKVATGYFDIEQWSKEMMY